MYLRFSVQFVTTSQFTLSERNGLVYKLHPQFLAQNLSKKVRLIHESLRYYPFCFMFSTQCRVLTAILHCVVTEKIHTPTMEGIGNSKGEGGRGSKTQEIPEERGVV